MTLIDREEIVLKAARELGMGGFSVSKLREAIAEQLRGAWSDGNRAAYESSNKTEPSEAEPSSSTLDLSDPKVQARLQEHYCE